MVMYYRIIGSIYPANLLCFKNQICNFLFVDALKIMEQSDYKYGIVKQMRSKIQKNKWLVKFKV